MKEKVLIIDDEESIRFGLTRLLQQAGYECVTAKSAAEGFQSFTENNPAVVLLDFKLPDSEGLDFMHKLKETDRYVSIIMMTGYFNTLPRELDEAVKVDGAGPMMALWRILVPLSIPGLVSVGIYTFMIAWNEYLFALTLTRTEDMRTVPIGIQLLMGQHSYRWNEMMAMSILGSLPVLVLFLVFQRYFIGGMTTGAVKN